MAELQERDIPYNFVFSGQHKKTIEELLDNFGIKKPDTILYSGSEVTSILGMLRWMSKLLVTKRSVLSHIWKGDDQGIVVNHGDTMSTLIGTLLARKQGLKTAHLEAGLRSYNLFHPFPEELIRIVVSALSGIFFAPNQWAYDNIRNNGKREIINTHYNTLIDALNSPNRKTSNSIKTPVKYVLVSIHRFENIFSKRRLTHILNCLNEVSNRIDLVFVLHEPTREKLQQSNLFNHLKKNNRITLIDRQDYFNFIHLLEKSEFLITDGGSNQEECYYLGKPCLIMRKKTERKEGLGENAVLSEYDLNKILHFTENYSTYRRPQIHPDATPSALVCQKLIPYSGP
ncbi:MAG: UDP-N-acetylglucosamine 2-epimerase [Pseudomonadales bacterium]